MKNRPLTLQKTIYPLPDNRPVVGDVPMSDDRRHAVATFPVAENRLSSLEAFYHHLFCIHVGRQGFEP
jgi:hypothetical protein